MATYTIRLPLARPHMTSNDQRRWGWRKVRDAKRETEEMVGWCAKRDLPKGLKLERIRLKVTWYVGDQRRRDPDSLSPTVKASLDSLVKCGYLVDDDSEHVLAVEQRIIRDPLDLRIEIEIEECAHG